MQTLQERLPLPAAQESPPGQALLRCARDPGPSTAQPAPRDRDWLLANREEKASEDLEGKKSTALNVQEERRADPSWVPVCSTSVLVDEEGVNSSLALG